ncbi:hypothetical protein LX81_00173 [Palleronia aestuarii]|uniref:DUF2065 domain-containing protein n=1 Tax=Palleronia aestuarii TaxID=568105 RepID=A0A2W7P2R0_9RHOB|nr:DUF2065 family protein [Palleronia aestuarii]PZX19716.1 hypothetical protein LX81_00173 [Palleronia aestuarii]
MSVVVLALGLVFCVEGLVLALAPSRIEDLLSFLTRLPPETRRLLGLTAVAVGAALVAGARALGTL